MLMISLCKSVTLIAQAIAALTLITIVAQASAQSLEPRAYANAPTDLNFLLVGYQNSTGGLVFDPSIPITDANTDVDIGLLGYVHTLDVAGNSAKVGVVASYASLSASGFVTDSDNNSNFRSRDVSGTADPTMFFAMNFIGAPALSLKDFKNYKQDTVVGFTISVTAPLGEYKPDKLINIGTNRWTIKPGLGVSKALGRWTLEGSVAAAFYTNNNDFDNGKTRKQDAIYSSQLHITYTFPHNIWAAVSATYFTGGRTSIEGVSSNDLQQNWRTGFTLALPVNRYHSIKLFASSGISTRTGGDFDSLGISWQYRWGGGL